MPGHEAPCVELGCVPETPSFFESPSSSEISSASSPEPQQIRATPLFRALAMPPPEPVQPPGQEELERRLPGYRRIVIPRELTLIELLKQCSGVTTDEEVLRIRDAKLRVVAERVGLRRLHVLAPRLRSLTLDGSALTSLRDLGIGLVHLKVLSVNRCGLTTLDGVWGLGALREFYASGNRLQDLQPLAALQKLHTLNLADNPNLDTGRIWTLGVCGSLRRLTLQGTPVSDSLTYRTRIASLLPMLVYLDEQPLHMDNEYDTDGVFGPASSSDSEFSDEEVPELMQPSIEAPPVELGPGPSSQFPETDTIAAKGDSLDLIQVSVPPERRYRRPATTENAGIRPQRLEIRQRPRTAHDRPTMDAPSRLQILNSLMETADAEKELVEQAMEEASRAFAAEIPRAPRMEDWARFKEETGIDIEIDFDQRPGDIESSQVIERLERIEKETMERFKLDNVGNSDGGETSSASNVAGASGAMTILSDFEIWKDIQNLPTLSESVLDVDSLFNDVSVIRPITSRFMRNTESPPE